MNTEYDTLGGKSGSTIGTTATPFVSSTGRLTPLLTSIRLRVPSLRAVRVSIVGTLGLVLTWRVEVAVPVSVLHCCPWEGVESPGKPAAWTPGSGTGGWEEARTWD